MRRGDLVTISLQGDYGKPRPALVVQSDIFTDARSKTVLPLTSTLIDAPLIRVQIEPTSENKLRAPSHVMIDKALFINVYFLLNYRTKKNKKGLRPFLV